MTSSNVLPYQRIRGAMAERGIKQTELARKMGLSAVAVSSKLTGKTGITVDQLVEMARVIGVTPSDLLDGVH